MVVFDVSDFNHDSVIHNTDISGLLSSNSCNSGNLLFILRTFINLHLIDENADSDSDVDLSLKHFSLLLTAECSLGTTPA